MTLNSDCEKLDAYLAGDLSDKDVARFESHSEVCIECRDAIDQQQWIDALLVSPARIQLELPPPAILDSVRSSLNRRRISQAAYGLAAAAALVVAVGWLGLNHQERRPADSEEQRIAATDAVHAPATIQPQATFISTADAITVPLESPSADVSVVQVYPTVDSERRRRLDFTLSINATKSNGG